MNMIQSISLFNYNHDKTADSHLLQRLLQLVEPLEGHAFQLLCFSPLQVLNLQVDHFALQLMLRQLFLHLLVRKLLNLKLL